MLDQLEMDKRNFKVIAEEGKTQIVFDQIFAEKVGGGIVKNSSFDLVPGLAVSSDGNVIKGYRVVEAASTSSSEIKIAKGSGVAVGDILAKGSVAASCTAVDTKSSVDYDVVTVSLGVELAIGDVLYEAASVSSDSATPKHTPAYLLGSYVPANSGDELVKLVNGANIRKETAPVADEVVAMMKGITKI